MPGHGFIGRLQTENDKKKVLDGLATVSSADNQLNLETLDKLISSVDPRVFVMNNVHDPGGPILLHTRWAMSYLRGPLTRDQIRRLMDPRMRQMTNQANTANLPLVPSHNIPRHMVHQPMDKQPPPQVAPPAYGQPQPPAAPTYGQQPPQVAPPAYGQQPPAYGVPPSATGPQPTLSQPYTPAPSAGGGFSSQPPSAPAYAPQQAAQYAPPPAGSPPPPMSLPERPGADRLGVVPPPPPLPENTGVYNPVQYQPPTAPFQNNTAGIAPTGFTPPPAPSQNRGITLCGAILCHRRRHPSNNLPIRLRHRPRPIKGVERPCRPQSYAPPTAPFTGQDADFNTGVAVPSAASRGKASKSAASGNTMSVTGFERDAALPTGYSFTPPVISSTINQF